VRAVDHAHRNLVVHRDLKPSNILVDAQGQPRLLDFGIARLLDDAPGVTRTGERVLTPSHASPEQITGGPVTTATDVYALGVLLYDLLAGKPPYGGGDTPPATLARQIVETEPPRPSAAVTDGSSRRLAAARDRGERLTPERLARELQGDLDNIVLMALRKEPERRYTSAAAMADDIERCLAHLPVRARPDTLVYRSAKFVRRHPVAVPVSAIAVVLALAGSAAFTWQLATERDRALAAEGAARSAEASAQRAAAFSASVLARTAAEDDAEREVSVQVLLQRAAERSAAELAGDASVGAQVDLALGNALTSWGRYEEGLAVLRRGLERARSRGDAGRADAAALHGVEGVTLHGLGRLEEGLAAAQASQALFAQAGTPAQQAQATLDVAMALNSLRRRDEAEPVFRDAIARLRAAHADEPGGDHDNLAFALNNLAWGLHARGRLAEAAPLYEEALAMQQRLGLGMADTGQTLSNLAGLYFDLGELDRAEPLWRQALQGYEALYGPDGHAAVARALALSAWVPMLRGRHDEALALLTRAHAANVRLVGERHRWSANSLVLRGSALLGAGRLGEAQAALQRALTLRRELLPPGHGDFFSVHLALGRLALAQGRPAAAETDLREALRIIDGLPTAGRRRSDEAALHLARALALQGRADEAAALAGRARADAQARFEPGDWRLRALQAQLLLPPLQAQPGEAERTAVQATLVLLRERLSPQAPLVRDIETALAAAR
jgi:eukaryotic-like serine/threonine-protein kinase